MFTFLRQIFFSLSISPLFLLIDSKNARVWSGSRRIPCARRILAARHHRDLTILESPRLKRPRAIRRFSTRSKPAKSIRSRRLKFVIRDASRWIIVHVSSRNRENLFLKRWSRNCYCYLPFHVPVLIPLPVVVPSLTFKFLNIALTMVLNIKEILRKWMLTGNLYDNFSKFFFFFFFSFCVYYKSDIYKLRSKVCFQSVEIEFRGETNDVSR